ncbi:MAG: hypothetical protein NT105_00780 [Verrucomicrobia bacterium]|nr:hypothetical protein [Verrucomicrobiota bacterium]
MNADELKRLKDDLDNARVLDGDLILTDGSSALVNAWIRENPELAEKINTAALQRYFSNQIAAGQKPSVEGFDYNDPKNLMSTAREIARALLKY